MLTAGGALLVQARRSGASSATLVRAASTFPALAGTLSIPADRWSNPQSWPNGRVPRANDKVVVAKPILLDVDAVVAGVLIEPAGQLLFDPSRSVLLQSKGNVEVRGALVMRPGAATTNHTLRFINVDETDFVGGGMQVLASDVGLWLTGAGVLDAAGAPKRAWTRATGALAQGAATVVVADASGWRVGDVVAITPTGAPPPDDGTNGGVEHCIGEERTITALSGRTLTLDEPLASAHPKVTLTDWNGQTKAYCAEVLNLTRNVVIEGTPEGRAHVAFLGVTRRQAISHVVVRHVGPRKIALSNSSRTVSVSGRYGLHFHMCGDATRGSLLEGVVVHGCGGHAFVPHDSHGITLRECVAHDVRNTAFWWDLREDDRTGTYQPATNDSLWDRCVASDVWADKAAADETRNAGFSLAAGEDLSNSCVGCVATGIRNWQGSIDSAQVSGFHWPESGGGAVWVFRDCLAHNIGGSGLFNWENDDNDHLIDRFTAYHSGAGITHGAYSNFYHYRRCALYANRTAGIGIAAVSRRLSSTPPTAAPISFEDIVIDGAGLTRWGVQSRSRKFDGPPDEPLLLARITVKGCRNAGYYEIDQRQSVHMRIVDCTFAAPEFFFDNGAPANTVIVVENLNGVPGTFTLRRRDQPGVYVFAWNARRS